MGGMPEPVVGGQFEIACMVRPIISVWLQLLSSEVSFKKIGSQTTGTGTSAQEVLR